LEKSESGCLGLWGNGIGKTKRNIEEQSAYHHLYEIIFRHQLQLR
jgi:hypothetical protein